MRLADCQNAFCRDGSLRDIYVDSTTEQDWDAFLSFLREGEHPLSYSQDGEAAPVPTRASEALRDTSCAHLLSIAVSGVIVNCHFFTADEIELDVAPGDVATQEALDGLLGFMRGIGDHLRKDVTLTAENSPELVLLRYSVDDGRLRKSRLAN